MAKPLRHFGRIIQAPNKTITAITAGPIAYQEELAATAVAPAQATEENASAKVAMRDEVWRRRK